MEGSIRVYQTLFCMFLNLCHYLALFVKCLKKKNLFFKYAYALGSAGMVMVDCEFEVLLKEGFSRCLQATN